MWQGRSPSGLDEDGASSADQGDSGKAELGRIIGRTGLKGTPSGQGGQLKWLSGTSWEQQEKVIATKTNI